MIFEKFESFVGVNFFTLIFAWANLLILYLVLRKILFRPIKGMIDSRQKEIDDMYESAEKDKSAAEAMRKDYEERLENAAEESEQMLRDAQRRALLKEEEILKEAAEQARRTKERAEEQIALEKRQAMNDIKDEVSAIAIQIAEAVVARDVAAEEHAELIDGFIAEMGDKND
ncbi:MAG: F0F1 ATP synthase subunit B [Clostridia bacterium]|nr:F0F1 ATP synthase subunit B [Clostridia bacterium]